MEHENEVTNVKLSRKLKELGVEQYAYYSHYFNAEEPTGHIVETSTYKTASKEFKDTKLLSAFTVTELGELFVFLIENDLVDVKDVNGR